MKNFLATHGGGKGKKGGGSPGTKPPSPTPVRVRPPRSPSPGKKPASPSPSLINRVGAFAGRLFQRGVNKVRDAASGFARGRRSAA